jgi:hypothetical protein
MCCRITYGKFEIGDRFFRVSPANFLFRIRLPLVHGVKGCSDMEYGERWYPVNLPQFTLTMGLYFPVSLTS